MKKLKSGQVIIPDGANPWPHERRVAKILAHAGHNVRFIPENGVTKVADIVLDGKEFEIKSPVSHNINAVERNLVRGLRQSCNIIFDASRMRRVHDKQILMKLTHRLRKGKGLKRILLVTKRGDIVDVNQLI